MQFPEPTPLNVLEIGNGKDDRKMVYSVEKPHPGYGKDPNILNEFGHSIYPKMVYPNGRSEKGVVVNSKEEEDKLNGGEVLKQDGPTVKEWVEAGYKASEYPPAGYAIKSSQDEINQLIEKEKAEATKAWG